MKIAICALLACLVFCSMVNNASASTVMGTLSCKQWEDRKNDAADRGVYTNWIQGYLSGANAIYGEMLDRDFIKDPDKVPVVAWTDAYCMRYPKSMLQDAANALIKYLKRDLQ